MTPQQKYKSPLTIPENKVGQYSIRHEVVPAGHEFSTAHSMRNQMFGGQKDVKFSYPHPVTVHRLQGPSGTWMTDLPVEHAQMLQCIKGMRGRVLVGGLGLGLAATLLAAKKSVKEVVVVEISKEVVKLVYPYIEQPKIKIATIDLFDYLKVIDEPYFDYALFDIWQSDSEGTFFETVCPLYEASFGKVKNPPVNWNENVMRGQLSWSIQSRLMFLQPEAQEAFKPTLKDHPKPWEEIGSIYWDWSAPFFKWWKERKPSDELTGHQAGLYAGIYGIWNWQHLWDYAIKYERM